MAKHRVQAKATDAAGVGPYARERENLVPLSEMRGWNVTQGEVDIRSWEVRTVSGRVLGSVRELLVDPKAGEVVMIDVDIAGSPEHAYVPLRVVEIDRARRVGRADSGDLETVGASEAVATPAAPLAEPAEPGPLADGGTVRYADGGGERIIERRPIVEETVVRRRPQDETEERL